MGIEHSAYTYVGVYTDDVGQWLVDQGFIDNIEVFEEEYDGCYDYAVTTLLSMDVTCENLMTGEGFYIGFETYDWKEYQSLINRFNEIVPGEHAEVHNFVKVH